MSVEWEAPQAVSGRAIGRDQMKKAALASAWIGFGALIAPVSSGCGSAHGAAGGSYEFCELEGQRSTARATQRTRLRSIQPVASLAPIGFRCDDDDSSVPFLLSRAELAKIGLAPKTQRLVKVDPKLLLKLMRRTPVLKVRIHAIRTANTNGSEAATITTQQVKQLVDQTNLVWWSSGIEFLYDPDKDFEHRNNTALNQDCSHSAFNQNVNNANWDPATSDKTANHNARTAVGNQFPKKLVCFFRYGTKFTWDEAAKKWTRGPATGGFSSSQSMYVAMSKGMPEKNLLAHEVGHYLHLPHTHVGGVDTVAKARKRIKDWVDVHGKTTQTALDSLNGDLGTITDTPSDCGGGIFVSKYGENANCKSEYPVIMIDVKFNSGYQAYYTLKPDKLNIMSYFKHCHALGTHRLSPKQIDRARAALISGNRKPLVN